MTRTRSTKTPAMDYEEAVRRLSAPSTWCEAARALALAGDRRAVMPLLEAYESPIEGGKRCLLEAMNELGAGDAAAELYQQGDARQRSNAVRLIELFGSDRHLPTLMRALSDQAEGVRVQARRAIVNQEWTNAWEAVMIQLLDSTDPPTQLIALESLRRRNSAAAKAALQLHGSGTQV